MLTDLCTGTYMDQSKTKLVEFLPQALAGKCWNLGDKSCEARLQNQLESAGSRSGSGPSRETRHLSDGLQFLLVNMRTRAGVSLARQVVPPTGMSVDWMWGQLG